MAKTKSKTLFSEKNNVDINRVKTSVTHSNQTGGKSKNKSKSKRKMKGGDSDDDYDNDNESDEDNESDDQDNGSDDENNESDDENNGSDNNSDFNDIDQNSDISGDEAESDYEKDSGDEAESDDDNESVNSEMSKKSKKSDKNDDSDYEKDEEKKCYSKYALNEGDDIEIEELIADEDFKIKSSSRISKPILFKYEAVRILSDRAKQLAQGAKPMVKNIEGLSPKEIAKLELKNKVIPLIIERPIPNSGVERWKLSELEIQEY